MQAFRGEPWHCRSASGTGSCSAICSQWWCSRKGAFGAFIYYTAAQQVVERMRVAARPPALPQSPRRLTAPVWKRRRGTTKPAVRSPRTCVLQPPTMPTSRFVYAKLLVPVDVEHIPCQFRQRGCTRCDGRRSARRPPCRESAPVPGGGGGYTIGVETRAGRVGDQLYILRLSAAPSRFWCACLPH